MVNSLGQPEVSEEHLGKEERHLWPHGQAVTTTVSEDLIRSSEMHAGPPDGPPVSSPTSSSNSPQRPTQSSWNPSLVITHLCYQ